MKVKPFTIRLLELFIYLYCILVFTFVRMMAVSSFFTLTDIQAFKAKYHTSCTMYILQKSQEKKTLDIKTFKQPP